MQSLPVPRTQFRPSGFFLARSPLLPFSALSTLTELQGATCDDDSSERSRSWREHLRALARAPVVQQAMVLGSTAFHAALSAWANSAEKDTRIELSLYR